MVMPLTQKNIEMLRSVIAILQAPRNRFGKIEPTNQQRNALRPYFIGADPPHGGLDALDQCAMTLQSFVGDPVKSMWEG